MAFINIWYLGRKVMKKFLLGKFLSDNNNEFSVMSSLFPAKLNNKKQVSYFNLSFGNNEFLWYLASHKLIWEYIKRNCGVKYLCDVYHWVKI